MVLLKIIKNCLVYENVYSIHFTSLALSGHVTLKLKSNEMYHILFSNLQIKNSWQQKFMIIFEIFLSFTSFLPLFHLLWFLLKEEAVMRDIICREQEA